MTLTTFNMAAGGNDGYRYRSDATYTSVSSDATGGGDDTSAKLYATRELNGGIYYIAVALLRWDTSSIPDTDVVSAATLDIYVETDTANPDSLSVVADWYDYGGSAGVNGDWANLDSGAAAISGVTIASLTEGAVNTLTLGDYAGNVNKAGYTGLRLGISKRASDAPPTGFTGLVFAGYESANQEPRLNVTHAAPAAAGTGNLLLLGVG